MHPPFGLNHRLGFWQASGLPKAFANVVMCDFAHLSMNLSSQDIRRVASLILSSCTGQNPDGIGLQLRMVVDQRKTKELLDELYGYPRWHTPTEEEEVRDVLDMLESLMQLSKLGALVLMARLFARADRLKVDYVCDSVIVHILKNKSYELRSQLELLLAEETDEYVKKTYRDWIWVMRPENINRRQV